MWWRSWCHSYRRIPVCLSWESGERIRQRLLYEISLSSILSRLLIDLLFLHLDHISFFFSSLSFLNLQRERHRDRERNAGLKLHVLEHRHREKEIERKNLINSSESVTPDNEGEEMKLFSFSFFIGKQNGESLYLNFTFLYLTSPEIFYTTWTSLSFSTSLSLSSCSFLFVDNRERQEERQRCCCCWQRREESQRGGAPHRPEEGKKS